MHDILELPIPGAQAEGGRRGRKGAGKTSVEETRKLSNPKDAAKVIKQLEDRMYQALGKSLLHHFGVREARLNVIMSSWVLSP